MLTNIKVKINFLDPVYDNSEKIKLFSQYDFFILPTKNENFGISILESLSRGLPVLTTTATPWSFIAQSNAGWIVNKIQPELRTNLVKIFRMKSDEFFIKSKNAVKLAKKFRWNLIFKEYMKTYKHLLNS
jgi:glycosyltransferase involved in cell wall biosynthesis